MATIVEQLQKDASDPSVAVAVLLQRVKIVAVKLKLASVEDWVSNETKGYSGEVPEYRKISGSLRAHNPYHGWVPIHGDAQTVSALSKTYSAQSIGELEDVLRQSQKGTLSIELGPYQVSILNDMMLQPFARYAVFTGRGPIVKIVESVRGLIIDWALDLERNGILGGEFSFSSDESLKAREGDVAINVGSISNFTGNLGTKNSIRDIDASYINMEGVKELLDKMRPHLDGLADEGADAQKLRSAISNIDLELSKPQPSPSAIRTLLADIRAAVVGATGSLIASGAVVGIQHLLS